jgi:Thioredoxin
MASDAVPAGEILRLQRAVDPLDDHVRGGSASNGVVSVVVYSDYLCPYCRRLRHVLARLRQTMGERLAYVFRHYPNERAHPGDTVALLMADQALPGSTDSAISKIGVLVGSILAAGLGALILTVPKAREFLPGAAEAAPLQANKPSPLR